MEMSSFLQKIFLIVFSVRAGGEMQNYKGGVFGGCNHDFPPNLLLQYFSLNPSPTFSNLSQILPKLASNFFAGCTSDQTDHAVTVVGYGTDAATGDCHCSAGWR